jgi:hypothetical protein
MSLLYIKIDSTSGLVNLEKPISAKKIKLVKYMIRFATQADSATSGELLNVKIFQDGAISSLVNSNRSKFSNHLPLANDTGSATTINTLDLVMDVNGKLIKDFKYSVNNSVGAPANFTSLQLWFEYF